MVTNRTAPWSWLRARRLVVAGSNSRGLSLSLPLCLFLLLHFIFFIHHLIIIHLEYLKVLYLVHMVQEIFDVWKGAPWYKKTK